MWSEKEALLGSSAGESEVGFANPLLEASLPSSKSEPDLITFSPEPAAPVVPPNSAQPSPAHRPRPDAGQPREWTFTLYNFDAQGFVSKKVRVLFASNPLFSVNLLRVVNAIAFEQPIGLFLGFSNEAGQILHQVPSEPCNGGRRALQSLEGLASSICDALSSVGVDGAGKLRLKLSLASDARVRSQRKRFARPAAARRPPPPPPTAAPPPDPVQKRPRAQDVLHLSQVPSHRSPFIELGQLPRQRQFPQAESTHACWCCQVGACCRAQEGSGPVRHCERHCHCAAQPRHPCPSPLHGRQAATFAAYYRTRVEAEGCEERSLASTHFFRPQHKRLPTQQHLYAQPL